MHVKADSPALSGVIKGLPLSSHPIQLSEIEAKGWNILREDVPFPAALLRSSALEQNRKVMRQFLDSFSGEVSLCPHGKTTMSPQLFEEQMADSAWGLTVATAQQLFVARRFGHKRILLANQLVGKQAVGYVLGELEDDHDFDFYCLVDSVDGVNLLLDQMGQHELARPLQVLLEIGSPGLRCGCRTKEDALNVARVVQNSGARLALRGIEAFEGLFSIDAVGGDDNPVGAFLEFVGDIARLIDQEALFSGGEILLTAGGSSYFDLVTDAFRSIQLNKPTRIVLRSGCYLIHDSGWYERFESARNKRLQKAAPLAEAALEVWTYVQSVPEPGLAILTAGKRDCGHDAGLPIPLKWFRPGMHACPQRLGDEHVVTALSDQHAHMRVPPGGDLRVGDMVGLGISHPCTTFDKWKLLFLVDDDYNITSAIETYF